MADKVKKRYKVKCIGDGLTMETAYRAEFLGDKELDGVRLKYIEQTPDYFIIEIDEPEEKQAKIKNLKGVDKEYIDGSSI